MPTRTSTRQRTAKAAPTQKTRSARTYDAGSGDETDGHDSDHGMNEATRSRPSRTKAARATKHSTPSSSSQRADTRKTRVEHDSAEDSDSDDDDDASLDSDALDDDPPPTRKRKRAVTNGKAKASPKKKRKAREDPESSDGLEEGQEIVGVVVEAPKTGRVPPGQVSQNTLDFLSQLKKPECNDREWFKLHQPVYRLAETEWKDFIESFTDVLVEADPQIPHLPPKDVSHRIYRDIRFSNDKTPYKTGFSASFSRSGRKGVWAGLKPNNESLLAAGTWCPGRNEIATIRTNLQRSSARLRRVLSNPRFEALFGKAEPHPQGKRQSVWGMGDELKVAPKGVDKNHKDIDLLKCRSFAVVHKFTDDEVLKPDFKEHLGRVAKVMRPFVHCMNDLMTIPDAGSGDEDEGEDEEEDEE